MIKNLRYLCTLLLIAVASAAWGDDVLVYTLDGTQTGGSNGYATESEITQDGMTWMVMGNTTMNPWRIGGKELTDEDRTAYSTTAMGSAISKIVLTLGTGADVTINSLKLTVASDPSFSTVLDEITRSEVTLSGDNVFTPTSGTEWATGAYYKFTFNLTIASDKNKFVQFSKVTFFKEKTSDSKKDATVTIGSTTLNIDETTTVSTDGPAFTLTTSDVAVASVSGTTVTGVAAGTATITAAWDEDDEFEGGTKTFTVTVVDPNGPGTEENPYTIAQARAAIDAGTGVTNVYVKGVISQIDSYNSTYGSITYWISEDGTTTNQFEVYGGLNLGNKKFESINDLKLGAEVVVFGNIKKFNNTYEFDKNNYLVSYVAPTISVAAPIFSPEAGTYTESQNVTITCETEGATIYYTVDGTEPTKASTTYTAAIEVSQTTTIKAVAYVGEVSSRVETATYEIQDPNAPGMSADNPYTVAQALAANPASSVYVKGIVSAVKEVSTEHGNATYNISDDGTTTNEMIVYRGKYLEEANFTSEEQIKIGDKVVVTGNLVVYNGANQLAQGNYLISLERPETPVTITAPSFEPNGGEFEAGTTVTVTINVPEDENVDYVEYSFDENTWTEYDTETTVITITETTTIYARSVGTDGRYSEVVSATYTIKAETPAEDVVIVEEGKTTFLFNTEGNEWGFPVGSANKIVEETAYTVNDVTIKVAGSKGNGFYYPTGTEKYLLMGKSGAYLTLPAFDFEVGKIEVVGASGASESVKQNIYVGDNAVSTETTGAKNVTNKYVIDADYRAAGNVYTLKVTNNYNTQISQIIVHKATGAEKADPQLKYSAATATATLGSEFAAPTLSYVEDFDGTVVYESSDERVATVDAEGNVTLVAAGETTIKATSAETDNYLPGEAFYTLTVKEPAVVGDNKYELVTDASTLKAGDEILIAYVDDDGATVMGEQKSNNRAGVAAIVNEDNTITPKSDAQTIMLEIDAENGWNFNVGTGYLYASSSTANQLKTESAIDANGNAKATIAIESNNATIIFQGNNTRNLMRFNPNNGSPLFACYALSAETGFLPQIYRKVTSTETHSGNVNGDTDGKVDIADVTALVNIIVNNSKPTAEQLSAGDFDNSGTLTVEDVEALVNKILGNQ